MSRGGRMGGWTVRAVCEMPRPSVADITQAQGINRVAKNGLTRGRRSDHTYVNRYRTVTTQDQSQ